jgi:hypothetical protein
MTTRVVHLRDTAYDVYIGRAGHGQSGYFGNPYAKGEKCSRCGEHHLTAASTLPCFSVYFLDRLGRDAEYRVRVLGLKGRVLGCFCRPGGPCHGRLMADWLDRPDDVLNDELDELVSRIA